MAKILLKITEIKEGPCKVIDGAPFLALIAQKWKSEGAREGKGQISPMPSSDRWAREQNIQLDCFSGFFHLQDRQKTLPRLRDLPPRPEVSHTT